MTRSRLALALLAAACVAALADALVGSGWFLDGPLGLALPALAGYAVGGWCGRWTAAAATAAGVVALTVAHQLVDQSYHWLDDLVFFAVVVAGPVVAGAAVTVRARQVARLEQLQAELDEQHRIDVAAARLDEQVRIQGDVHTRLAERIASIAVRAEGARVAEGGPALTEIEAEARGVLDELRSVLGSLAAGPAAARAPSPQAAAAPRPSRLDVVLVVAIAVGLTVEAAVIDAARGPLWANALAAVAVAAPLVVRRSRPLLAVGLSLLAGVVASASLTPLAGTVTGVGLLVLVFYTIGAWSRGWWWVPGWVVAASGMLALELVSGLAQDGQDGDAAWIVLFWTVGAVALGRITAGWQERVRRTREVVDELERSRGAAVRLAIAEQRQDIAGELHDSVAHAMTVICLQAGGARATGQAAEQVLETIAGTAAASLAEMRHGLDEIAGATNLEADRITALGRRLGVDVEVAVAGRGDAGRRTTGLAQRVVREALVNIARHAPGAPARVDLTFADGAVVIEVSNPATATRPFPHGTGTGLNGLAAALAGVGGRLDFGPRPEGGYRVAATIPEEAT